MTTARPIQLPLKAWDNILGRLSKYNLAPCLMVSRALHGIAQRLIFSSVTLLFVDEMTEEDRYLAGRTWDILREIISNTQFASVIRDLKVLMCKRSLLIFEYRYMLEAIQMIPHIQSFSWFCMVESRPNEHVLAQVASYLSVLPKNLSSLSVPVPGLYINNANGFDFRCLKQLTIASESFNVGKDPESLIRKQIEANYSSLRDLAISGAQMLRLPEQAFTQLTKLALYHLDNEEEDWRSLTEKVSLILRHTFNLDTLDLQGGLPSCGPLFPTLAKESSILPHLKRLRVVTRGTSLGRSFYSALNEFICARKALLKSLDLSFGEWESWEDISLLLPSLSHAQVIGIRPGIEFCTSKQTHALSDHLQQDIRALRIGVGSTKATIYYHLLKAGISSPSYRVERHAL